MLLNRNSISFRFSLVIIGVTFGVLACVLAFTAFLQNQQNEDLLQKKLSHLAELTRLSVLQSLQQSDTAFFQEFMQTLLQDETLAAASILRDGQVLTDAIRPGISLREWTDFERSSKFVTLTSEIAHKNIVLGTLRLAALRPAALLNISLDTTGLIGIGALLAFAIFVTTLWLTIHYITRPLSHITHVAGMISQGTFDDRLGFMRYTRNRHDELGKLSQVFQEMTSYLQKMIDVATQISQGDLDLALEQQSEEDVLGQALQRMQEYFRQIGQVAAHIAEGNLQDRVELRSTRDRLGMSFSHMSEGLIELISNLRNGSKYLSSISDLVLNISSRSTTVLQKIGSSADESFDAMQGLSVGGEELRVNMETLNSTVTDTSAFIQEMGGSITQVTANAGKLSQFAEDTNATMVEVVNSLETISKQAEHSRELSDTANHDAVSGRDAVEQTINSMTAISSITENISDVTGNLEHHSSDIASILDVINDVAEQTSLLALNASIISAQAGSHGKGFSVVADEIKGLAVRVRSSTREIAEIVKAVQYESSRAVTAIRHGQDEVDRGVVLAHKAGEALYKISENAGSSASVAAEIANSVRQQTVIHAEMTESIRDVSTMSAQISQAITNQEHQTGDLTSIMTSLQGMEEHVLGVIQQQQQKSYHVAELMEGVLQFVQEHSQTLNELSASANELQFQANALHEHVERFNLPGQQHEESAEVQTLETDENDDSEEDIASALDQLIGSD